MHKHILARSVGLALLASGLLAGCGDKGGPAGHGEMPPAAVDVVTLHTAPAAVVRAHRSHRPLRVAEVRPQVNGIILKRLFTEGSDVKGRPAAVSDRSRRLSGRRGFRQANLAKAEANERSAALASGPALRRAGEGEAISRPGV